MKKLVTVACALVAGIAIADGVTSANTVGYIGKDAESDVYTPVAVMLTDVGVNTLAISSIVFDGIGDFDSLQIFGDDGNVATELFRDGTGWVDDSNDDASTWVFQPGDSFWIAPCNGVTVTATFPGEVKAQGISITADSDVYTPFGNGTAKAVSISEVMFTNINDFDSLQIFGNDGNVATELFRDGNGWVDDSSQDASNWIFQPGDEFWIAPCNGVTVTVAFPAAI